MAPRASLRIGAVLQDTRFSVIGPTEVRDGDTLSTPLASLGHRTSDPCSWLQAQGPGQPGIEG